MGMRVCFGLLFGAHWRRLQKISVELLNSARLDSFYGLRRREIRSMVSQVYASRGTPVQICELLHIALYNVMTSMLWGGRLDGEERSRMFKEFRHFVDQLLGLIGKPNVSDFFSTVAWLDIQGVVRKTKKLMSVYDQIVDSVVQERSNVCMLIMGFFEEAFWLFEKLQWMFLLSYT
ncbi:hypothetical protein CRYUN_Cryun13aG0130700 [Craigia yunnanensis]